MLREHPEWLAGSYDDYFGAGFLCLDHTPCREWLEGEILRLIDTERIDYIIQDGEDMVKRCTRTDHTHASGDSNYSGSTCGIDLLIENLRRKRPSLVLENCEDGGCMMTYKMARLYHTSITVDNIATYATRQGVFGASYPFSPRYSVRYMEDDPTPYTLRSSIFGGPLILMQRIGDWDERQLADTRAAIWRTLVDAFHLGCGSRRWCGHAPDVAFWRCNEYQHREAHHVAGGCAALALRPSYN